MAARPADIDLARVLTMLSGPLSARQRKECRAIIARHVLAPAGGISAEQAQAAMLSAAAALAGHGWGEVEIRDALNEEGACLDRSGRRQRRA